MHINVDGTVLQVYPFGPRFLLFAVLVWYSIVIWQYCHLATMRPPEKKIEGSTKPA